MVVLFTSHAWKSILLVHLSDTFLCTLTVGWKWRNSELSLRFQSRKSMILSKILCTFCDTLVYCVILFSNRHSTYFWTYLSAIFNISILYHTVNSVEFWFTNEFKYGETLSRSIYTVIRRKKNSHTLLATYVKVDMPILVYKATTC